MPFFAGLDIIYFFPREKQPFSRLSGGFAYEGPLKDNEKRVFIS